MRPQLKDVAWEVIDGPERQLRLVYDLRDQFILEDPDGSIERLLELLRTGKYTVSGLAGALGVPADDITGAIELFDDYGLLEDAHRLGRLTEPERERYFSNLAFFESFASMDRSREDFQLRLRDSHVLVLGTGGLNSHVIPSLCGLGVGRVTLLDRDAVEARNFARQFLFRWDDLGARKVERVADWISRFGPWTEVVAAIDHEITGIDDVGELLDQHRPDVVASGVDHPLEIDAWVNAACVSRGIPYVRGGMWVTQGLIWSVDPGFSACRACRAASQSETGSAEFAETRAGVALFGSRGPTNRAIGPVAGLLGSLVAFEVLRYLVRFEEPAYCHGPVVIDFANGCRTRQEEWARDPDCPVCRR